MTKHVVSPGDWLGAIADAYGFDHWSQIWDHPSNDLLRERRGSADLVLVGDEVTIPPPNEARGIAVTAGQRVVFRARDPHDVLRLRIDGLGPFIAVFGPVPFRFEAGSQVVEGTIESEDQELRLTLEPSARKAKLVLAGSQTYEFHIGGLGPVEEDAGALGRLANLGFRGELISGDDPSPGDDGPDRAMDPQTVAVLQFQARHGLDRTGRLDDATRSRVKREYGG